MSTRPSKALSSKLIACLSVATVLILSSAVGAFISSSSSLQQQCQYTTSTQIDQINRQRIISPSILHAAYIDENFPHGSIGVEASSSDANTNQINNDAQQQQKQQQQQSLSSSISTKKKPPRTLPNGATLTLVGAGPGSPDLLTLAAHRIITDPNNYLIVDRLVSQEILDLIVGEYKIANKYPGCADIAQDEIYDWCREGLDEGRHVVRLKIGDPFVFGRGGEEVLKFRSHGIEPTIIPGVSAAFSAPLLGSIPVTHRGVSNQVVMCTGYGRNNTSPDLIQYHKEQTVVFLMAVGRLRTLCEKLVKMANYPIDTPVGIVESAGCPNQRTVVGTMENIADLAEKYNVKPPSTIVVGDVVNVLLTEDDFGTEIDECKQQGLVQSIV